MFVKYHKIHRLGKDEVDGILEGTCVIQEKIDGANTVLWVEDGKLCFGSRNRQLPETESFRGFIEYVKGHAGINLLLEDHPDYVLYSEWAVRHTIAYKELSYNHLYLFDIVCNGEFLKPEYVIEIAKIYNIKHPQIFATLENPTPDQIMPFVGQTELGDKGEGVVIKNIGFRNKFDDLVYAKIVTESFKEDNGIIFGGNNKHSESYWEVYVMNKYISLARVQKVLEKLETAENRRGELSDIPRVINTVYHDMLTEEIWEIATKVGVINFPTLKKLAMKKAALLYKEIIEARITGNLVRLESL